MGREIGQGGRGGGTKERRRKRQREREGKKEERDAPRANSLLAGSARSAMPNPGGTAYTPFPAHPLDEHAALSLLLSHSPILLPLVNHLAMLVFFSRTSPTPSTLHKVAIYSRLSRPHSSFFSSPTTARLPLRFSYPHRRGRRDTHQLRHSRVPSVHLPPALREYSHGCLPRSSPTPTSLSLSLSRAAPLDDRRAEVRRQASQIRFSQLRLRSVGSERRPEEFASMRRAALPASCM